MRWKTDIYCEHVAVKNALMSVAGATTLISAEGQQFTHLCFCISVKMSTQQIGNNILVYYENSYACRPPERVLGNPPSVLDILRTIV